MDNQPSRHHKRELRRAYDELYRDVLGILFEADPAGIIFLPDGGQQRDEYSPEVRTILPRLRSARDEDDVAEIMHQEFEHWFGKTTAGPRAKYRRAASAVWAAWQRYQARIGP